MQSALEAQVIQLHKTSFQKYAIFPVKSVKSNHEQYNNQVKAAKVAVAEVLLEEVRLQPQ